MRSSRVLLSDDHPSLAAAFREDVAEILLTNYGDANVVRHALDVGASGFVSKVNGPTELVEAIRTVVDGGTYVSSAIAV